MVEQDRRRATSCDVEPHGAFSGQEFRVGSAMSKAMAVLLRNLLAFGVVTAAASLPTVLVPKAADGVAHGFRYKFGNLEATPLVEDGIMYVPDGWGSVYAID